MHDWNDGTLHSAKTRKELNILIKEATGSDDGNAMPYTVGISCFLFKNHLNYIF